MGYYAQGDGYLNLTDRDGFLSAVVGLADEVSVLLTGEQEDDAIEIFEAFGFDDVDVDVNGVSLHYNAKWREEWVRPLLKAIAPHVCDSSLSFVGEDESPWKYEVGNGAVKEFEPGAWREVWSYTA